MSDILVLDLHGFFDQHAFQYLSSVGAARDCGAAAESFEYSFVNFASLFVHLNLQLHYVTAGWSSNKPRANVRVLLIQRTNISRILVMV